MNFQKEYLKFLENHSQVEDCEKVTVILMLEKGGRLEGQFNIEDNLGHVLDAWREKLGVAKKKDVAVIDYHDMRIRREHFSSHTLKSLGLIRGGKGVFWFSYQFDIRSVFSSSSEDEEEEVKVLN